MGIKLSREDQILLLHGTAKSLRAIEVRLDKVDFDCDLIRYAHELSGGINSTIFNSCIETLKTDEELAEINSDMLADREHIAMERSAYYAQQL